MTRVLTDEEAGFLAGVASLAAEFCALPETYPVFTAWARLRGLDITLDLVQSADMFVTTLAARLNDRVPA